MAQIETQLTALTTGARRLRCAQRLFPLLFISALPVALTSPLWLQVWHGVRPRATNGSGHYAIAQLYDRTIFPDTFGWTHAYFSGMPFPNFYPPLFYWLVALLNHTHLVSFNVAFKLVMALPLLLLPAAIWTLTWFVAHKRAVANCAACASLLLLFVPQFQLTTISGLDYFSTLVVGLYTQPLGFVLLLGWYAAYLDAHRRRWYFALSAVMLALTVLANFFNAITATVFIACVLVNDLWRYRCAHNGATHTHARNKLAAHLASPLVAACLSMFWLGPMLGESGYLVTRPFIIPLRELVPPALLIWYAVAGCGLALGLRRANRALWAYSLACLALGGGIICSGTFAPRWFPLQSYRFLSTLNFLLAVPVGLAVTTGYSLFAQQLRKLDFLKTTAHSTAQARKAHRTAHSFAFSFACAFGALIFVGVMMARAPVRSTLTFYQQAQPEQIDGVLQFAAQHRNGRYLVELAEPQSAYTEAGYDSRALSAYLGLQGNESLGIIFRESSPNVLFVNPQLNAFSAHADNHGISSILADDQDFITQPLSTHLARAQQLGVKYLVVATNAMKERLRTEAEIGVRYDLGAWSVFELRHDPPAPVRALTNRPALVVSSFSLKGRRRDESGFVRLAEEQFADNWFDVLLARSPETKLDRLRELDQFGALILDTYDCDDEESAYTQLRAYAQQRPLILLASNAPLYQRIERARAEFPHAQFITHTPSERGPWVESLTPSHHYNADAIRQQWQVIRQALAQNKIAIAPAEAAALSGTVEQNSLHINIAHAPTARVPVLLDTTFHPNWQRADGQPVYAATPFAMLTFVDQPVSLNYTRRTHEQFALLASAIALLALCAFILWPTRQHYFVPSRPQRAPRFTRWTNAKRFTGN